MFFLETNLLPFVLTLTKEIKHKKTKEKKTQKIIKK